MSEHRRPAGVDPAVLRVRPGLPVEHDELAAAAAAIGRRAALKVIAAEVRTSEPLPAETIAEIVEAEIYSSAGLGEGEIVLRFRYEEAVQAVTAIVEATGPHRGPGENATLGDLRERFLLALGLL